MKDIALKGRNPSLASRVSCISEVHPCIVAVGVRDGPNSPRKREEGAIPGDAQMGGVRWTEGYPSVHAGRTERPPAVRHFGN